MLAVYSWPRAIESEAQVKIIRISFSFSVTNWMNDRIWEEKMFYPIGMLSPSSLTLFNSCFIPVKNLAEEIIEFSKFKSELTWNLISCNMDITTRRKYWNICMKCDEFSIYQTKPRINLKATYIHNIIVVWGNRLNFGYCTYKGDKMSSKNIEKKTSLTIWLTVTMPQFIA